MTKKIGIFGGTFDPVHLGHLITTQFVLEKRRLEKIIFVPCNISPLKSDQHASPQHRLNMLNFAIKDFNQFEISDYEIVKGDISYTYDTLLELKKYYNEIELIIGFDNLVVFDKWKNPNGIFELAKVIVMKRKVDTLPSEKNLFFNDAVIIETPEIEISSTEIRNRIKNDLPIDFLVPEKVKEYIYRHSLYK